MTLAPTRHDDEHTYTRSELLAARERPPLIEAPPGDPRYLQPEAGERFGRARQFAPHGTNTRYAHGCRCEPCRAARREYTRTLAARRRDQRQREENRAS